MMQQGVSFSGEGPIMQGTWYNPSNGDQFTVRDSFFENNQYIVTTTDGRTLNYNQIQNYIKSDKPIQVEPKKTISQDLPPEVSSILEESADGMLPEDSALLGNLYQENKPVNNQLAKPMVQPEPVNTDNYIIEKALSKTKLPKLNFQIDWKEFPEKQIEMLETMMDISKKDIVNWYVSQINKEEISKEIMGEMEEYIFNKFNPAPEETPKTRKKSTKTSK